MTTRKSTQAQANGADEKIIIPEAAKIINPFDDLDALSGSQDFEELAGVKKALVTVPIRKPGKSSFIRVHPDPEYRKDFWCLEYGDEQRQLYIATLARRVRSKAALPDRRKHADRRVLCQRRNGLPSRVGLAHAGAGSGPIRRVPTAH